MSQTRVFLATVPAPGAVGLIGLLGPGVQDTLQQLTGVTDWPMSRLRLVNLGNIDQGLAVRIREDHAQLMPHGGPRVITKLIDRLTNAGAAYDPQPTPLDLYPEAVTELEADALAHLATAASPAAVDLLLAQSNLWQSRLNNETPFTETEARQILDRSDKLNHLITPPAVVVIGRPNVGKSTLTNRLLGRTASIVADLPGTTRDWVSGLAELRPQTNTPASAGIAVRWIDTPGFRHSDDPIEQQAITLAKQAIAQAHVRIAMRDPDTDWPHPDALQENPHIWVMNKTDRPTHHATKPLQTADGKTPDTPLRISALHSQGVDKLERCVLDRLGLAPNPSHKLWAFSPALRGVLASPSPKLAHYARVPSA